MNRPKKSALFRRLRMTFFCVPLAAIFLLPQLFSGFLLPRQVETAVIHTAAGDVTRREFETSNSSFTQHIRTWTDAENTAVRSDRFAPVSGTQTHESTVLTVKGTGTMRTYDVKANRWSEAPLRAGTFPKGMYFIRADGGDSIALIRGDQIRIRRSDNYTLLADTGIRSFYETAFGKLTDRL